MMSNDHTVLVTGGTRGIGRAVSLRVASTYRGTVILNYLQRSDEALKTCKMVEDAGARPILIQANLQYADEIERLCATVLEHTDRIDGVVHCAATTNFRMPLELRPHHLDNILRMNVTSLLDIVQRLSEYMPNGASIIAMSSTGSQRVVPHYTAMGVAKAALESLVRYLAVAMAGQGVRVNTIAAGLVPTESTEQMPLRDLLVAEVIRRTPFGRIGSVEEVASVVEYLLSNHASWITGQTLTVDGGLTLA